MKIIDGLSADVVDLSGLDRVEQICDDVLVFRNTHRQMGLTMVKLPLKSIERIELILKLESAVHLNMREPDDPVAAQESEPFRGGATRDEPMI